MSIRYITHKDIDFEKWDHTIQLSTNALIYAESWFLDIVTNRQWDALVEDDYQAVMPLPYNRKLFGYYQLVQPLFCQQLGVFSLQTDIPVVTFIDHIPSKFKRQHYHFNWLNQHKELIEKTNLILPLQEGYEAIESRFSKSLRKRIRQNQHLTLETSDDVKATIEFYRNALESKVQLGAVGYDIAQRLFTEAVKRHVAINYQLKDQGQVVARGVFLHRFGRVTNVFAASDPQHPNAMSVLLAKVIERHCGADTIFDFEGSEIPGIRQYFLSFGAQSQPYFKRQTNQLPFWIKWLRPN